MNTFILASSKNEHGKQNISLLQSQRSGKRGLSCHHFLLHLLLLRHLRMGCTTASSIPRRWRRNPCRGCWTLEQAPGLFYLCPGACSCHERGCSAWHATSRLHVHPQWCLYRPGTTQEITGAYLCAIFFCSAECLGVVYRLVRSKQGCKARVAPVAVRLNACTCLNHVPQIHVHVLLRSLAHMFCTNLECFAWPVRVEAVGYSCLVPQYSLLRSGGWKWKLSDDTPFYAAGERRNLCFFLHGLWLQSHPPRRYLPDSQLCPWHTCTRLSKIFLMLQWLFDIT